ncbi:hypothetical protein K5F93_22825 [Pseudomonas protegens]|uniref:hypothetical protein n=1 Tax=Pseudomonas protegens TaxID=380021 RepID=UPI001C8D9890|nr:hypothetical protein [Pseudomonas protegens]QZI73835.1 hypothetical protein K5F93_22825 [Pseudomonas protegens]
MLGIFGITQWRVEIGGDGGETFSFGQGRVYVEWFPAADQTALQVWSKALWPAPTRWRPESAVCLIRKYDDSQVYFDCKKDVYTLLESEEYLSARL